MLLEVGCGPGNVLKYLTTYKPELQVLGIDLAPRMIELAKNNVPGADFMVMDCDDILKIKKKFNAIVCAFVMPYLSMEQCAKLIGDCANLLYENGMIYISAMEGDYHDSGFESTSFSDGKEVYIYYHQKDNLKNELNKNGFIVISYQTKQYPESDGHFFNGYDFLWQKKV